MNRIQPGMHATSAPCPNSCGGEFALSMIKARCTDDSQHAFHGCAHISGAALRLCQGVSRLHASSCAQLTDIDFVASIISEVGLVPDPRGDWLYGNASSHMVCQPGTAGCDTFGRSGLWQEPLQLSAALVHIASNAVIKHVHTYVEVGVWTAWTCVFISAYLTRMGSPGSFRGAAVDISRDHISQSTRTLLSAHNVTYVSRFYLDTWLQRQEWGASPIDLCFIDANHSYAAVRSDFEYFAPRCRAVMLHDIQVHATTMQPCAGAARAAVLPCAPSRLCACRCASCTICVISTPLRHLPLRHPRRPPPPRPRSVNTPCECPLRTRPTSGTTGMHEEGACPACGISWSRARHRADRPRSRGSTRPPGPCLASASSRQTRAAPPSPITCPRGVRGGSAATRGTAFARQPGICAVK